MKNERDTPENRRALQALEGRECVYKEKTIICLVRVTDVQPSEWGVGFKLDVVPAPGFVDLGKTPLGMSATWEVLGVGDDYVHATWASWMLVFNPDMVETIKERAREHPAPTVLMNIVNEVANGDLRRPAKDT